MWFNIQFSINCFLKYKTHLLYKPRLKVLWVKGKPKEKALWQFESHQIKSLRNEETEPLAWKGNSEAILASSKFRPKRTKMVIDQPLIEAYSNIQSPKPTFGYQIALYSQWQVQYTKGFTSQSWSNSLSATEALSHHLVRQDMTDKHSQPNHPADFLQSLKLSPQYLLYGSWSIYSEIVSFTSNHFYSYLDLSRFYTSLLKEDAESRLFLKKPY